VHGDEGGGRGGDDDDGLVVPCEAKDLFRIPWMYDWEDEMTYGLCVLDL